MAVIAVNFGAGSRNRSRLSRAIVPLISDTTRVLARARSNGLTSVGSMRRIGALLVLLLVATACGSGTSATDSTEVSFTPGERSFGQVTIDGTVVEYISLVPAGFSTGDTAPVLLALPPGAQDAGMATAIVRDILQVEALARGWVVVSPAAPDGELFFQGSERFIPGFIDFIESWVSPEGGGVHLAGVSNGGISSFRVATQNPDRFRSVTVFPGFPTSDADIEALDALTHLPVHMFVGERDTGWIDPMESAANRLTELGADVTYEVFPNEGHIIGTLGDGVRVFDGLDAAR